MTTFPCPFVYANGKRCTGHIVRVKAYGADLSWQLEADGTWSFGFTIRAPTSTCSALSMGITPVTAGLMRMR